LLMGMDRISHGNIWKAFFESAPKESYTFLVHCKEAEKCQASLDSQGLSPFAQVVPIVYNEWCKDLVSPMLQLLKHALAATRSEDFPIDKFAFVSTMHLPIKPLWYLSREFAKRPDESDMCVHVTHWWASMKANSSIMAPSCFQWSIFSRKDAQTLLRKMPPPSATSPLVVPPVEGYKFSDLDTVHCIDEMTIFYTLYGLAHVPGSDDVDLNFPGFGELHYPLEANQGRCPYFGYDGMPHMVSRHAWIYGDKQAQAALQLQDTYGTLFHGPGTHCTGGCEFIWTIFELSANGMRFLRNSDYLFARKVADDALLPNYARIVFS